LRQGSSAAGWVVLDFKTYGGRYGIADYQPDKPIVSCGLYTKINCAWTSMNNHCPYDYWGMAI